MYSGNELAHEAASGGGITIHQIDRTASPADSIVAVKYDQEIRSIWK